MIDCSDFRMNSVPPLPPGLTFEVNSALRITQLSGHTRMQLDADQLREYCAGTPQAEPSWAEGSREDRLVGLQRGLSGIRMYRWVEMDKSSMGLERGGLSNVDDAGASGDKRFANGGMGCYRACYEGGYASPTVYDFLSAPIPRTCEGGQDPFYGTIMRMERMREEKENEDRFVAGRGNSESGDERPKCKQRGQQWMDEEEEMNPQAEKEEAEKEGMREGTDAEGDEKDTEEEKEVGGEESSCETWETWPGIVEMDEVGPKSRKSSLAESLGLACFARKGRRKDRGRKKVGQRTDKESKKTEKFTKNQHVTVSDEKCEIFRSRAVTMSDNSPWADYPRYSDITEPQGKRQIHGKYRRRKGVPHQRKENAVIEEDLAVEAQTQKGSPRKPADSPFFGNGTRVDVLSSSQSSIISEDRESPLMGKISMGSPKSHQRSFSPRDSNESNAESRSTSSRSAASKLSISFMSLISGRRGSSPSQDFEIDDTFSEDFPPSAYADDDYVTFNLSSSSPLKPKRNGYITRLVTGRVH